MRMSLKKRLLLITIVNIIIIIIFLLLIMPKLLTPIYEKDTFRFLKNPHSYIKQNTTDNIDDIAYFFLNTNKILEMSDNYYDILKEAPHEIILKLDKKNGTFISNGDKYYYYKTGNGKVNRITLTNSDYVNNLIKQTLFIVLSITIFVVLITTLLLYFWSKKIVNKITILKNKIENIENKDYDHKNYFEDDIEIDTLYNSIEDMRKHLIKTENQKNEMFQNISHDLKTPLTVISSHSEAIGDNVIDLEDGLSVITEQTDKLKDKVNSMLYITKLEYLEDKYENINITPIIKTSVSKFKLINPKLRWEILSDNSKFVGTTEMWEVVIDNILDNFLRYANKNITIEVKNKEIVFFNDGNKIETELLKTLFKPYEKGEKGNFGLGLAIVKKTVNLFGYNISVKNKEKGVYFSIK